jgi:hypothetical protein
MSPEEEAAAVVAMTAIIRDSRLYMTVFFISGTVSSILLVKLLFSAVSATSRDILKRDLVLCLWTIIPILTVMFVLNHAESIPLTRDFLRPGIVFSGAYSALIMGNYFRRFLVPKSRIPKATSFPLAALVFTAILSFALYFFIPNGLFEMQSAENCGSSDDAPPCNLLDYEEYYLPFAAFLVIAVCGFSMSPEANLVTLYDDIFSLLKRSPAHQPIKTTESHLSAAVAQEPASSTSHPPTPPPAPTSEAACPSQSPTPPLTPEAAAPPEKLSPIAKSSPAPPVPEASPVLQAVPPQDGIVLKLKRSQKTGSMGGLIYMLDARIDASAEILTLISTHRLGSRLIYESTARQQHAEAAKAHLGGSRSDTSIFAPPSKQAMGAAKTMWKLGRAAVSAARAALSLRITVDSLLAGVHVECKSMEELLEAETAIREAKGNLEGYITTLTSFDGQEEIV